MIVDEKKSPTYQQQAINEPIIIHQGIKPTCRCSYNDSVKNQFGMKAPEKFYNSGFWIM